MRRLPKNKTEEHKRIIFACHDFFGKAETAEESKSANRVALVLMGREKGINLTEEDKSVLWYVRQNRINDK